MSEVDDFQVICDILWIIVIPQVHISQSDFSICSLNDAGFVVNLNKLDVFYL